MRSNNRSAVVALVLATSITLATSVWPTEPSQAASASSPSTQRTQWSKDLSHPARPIIHFANRVQPGQRQQDRRRVGVRAIADRNAAAYQAGVAALGVDGTPRTRTCRQDCRNLRSVCWPNHRKRRPAKPSSPVSRVGRHR